MGAGKYFFVGTTEAYHGLCNHHPHTQIELLSFKDLKVDFLKRSNTSIVLHIGRAGICFSENENELLLLTLVLSNLAQPILLTSFLAREHCSNKSNLFNHFPYLRLPYTFDHIMPPASGLTPSIALKYVQKTNFRDNYLKHEVENETLPKKSYKIFDKNLKAIRNES